MYKIIVAFALLCIAFSQCQITNIGYCQDEPIDSVVNDNEIKVSFSDSNGKLVVKKTESGHILFKGKIKDVEGWLIFDTGASVNVVSKRFADILELSPIEGLEANVESSGGTQKTNILEIDELDLGSVKFNNLRFVDLNLDAMENAWKLNVLGILGYPALKHMVVEVDQKAGTLEFHDPKKYERKVAWREAELRNGQLLVEAVFEGNKGKFTTDTGATWNGILHAPTVKKFDMLSNRESTSESTEGIGPASKFEVAKLSEFTVWGNTYKDVEFAFSTATEGAFAAGHVDGNIGLGIINRYVLILDFSNGRYAAVEKQADSDQ